MTSLHSHCMQVLSNAREQLPPEVCMLGNSSSTSGSSGAGSSADAAIQQQQQQQWRLCCTQVQHDLLLVLQITKHWQQQNAHRCLHEVVLKKR